MTYLLEWDGVRIADDALTLALMGNERPGSILPSGCGSCASCTGVESPQFQYVRSDLAGLHGLVEEGDDWVVQSAAGQGGYALVRAGSDYVVSDQVLEAGRTVQEAPWYHVGSPASGDFLGAIVTDMQGLMDRPTSARVVEGIADGGWVAGLREGPREVRVKMTLLALSESGLNAGQAWLAGIVGCSNVQACGSGAVVRAGVACPSERGRFGISGSSATSQLVDRQLVGCVTIAGPEVTGQMDSCGLWRRDVEFGIVSQRGKLMRPTIEQTDHIAGTVRAGVVVSRESGLTVPALCPPEPPTKVMRDPNSPLPPSPVQESSSGSWNNRTSFSHKARVAVPDVDEPWVERALSITLHADSNVPGARVRIFPQSDYTSCGEVAEFYVQWISAGYNITIDGVEGEIFAWHLNRWNWAQGSHLVRSIYANGYFQYPSVRGGDGYYVLVESEGYVGISVESAVIE